ncbi:MAG: restriction endonuclease subunit M [Deltaproteobacteria bacterium RBG_16_48_10]|nr:MAG: restriction endonuclease subunit M [Deltaproteobacteria bacterium RBG_16_48_10]
MKEALHPISNLVERFERNIEAYRSPAYNETQLRREFVDPFFEAFGWDVTNKAGYAEQYKDVIHEDAIKVAGATKAPDYCFRIGGARKFFLETKKPSIDIKEQTSPAYQLRRYAWSAKLPLSILTDFEELAIYDCRLRPKPNDKSSVGRIRFYNYKQYLNSFEEIYNLLAKESVLKGSFDKFAESEKQKRGTTEVDAEFLKEIESWRDALAKTIAIKNPNLLIRELNFAVQLTIDRIIFLRMCEDRGIEPYGQIQTLQNGTNTFNRLRQIFYRADGKYNSGLFDFRLDQLTPKLSIDDKPLKDIFKTLYYPESPYEFSVLGADILGHVYEQFLGKVIRLTEGHRAKVEEKPEVRKAGGVYYTPTYIVEYIVKNTVGKLCEGKTPRQISSLHILDPACGSGSFLLGAYQYLLDYHRDWYQKNNPGKHTEEIFQGYGGQWYLTTREKKRILLNSIYGVDIDPQAVEVTKLSLLLKVLEGENQDTLERQMKLFKERALPDLGSNIKCGNSLIAPDFYQNKQLNLLDKDEMYRINPFDWEKEFPEITKRGGFDAVIGNPPYIRIQTMKEWASREVELYKQYYAAASKGNYDIYVVFVERGLNLLNKQGVLGFILPHKFFNAQYGQSLRGLLAKGKYLSKVVHFGDKQIFAGATNYTCLLFLDKTGSKQCHFIKVDDVTGWRNTGEATEGKIPSPRISASVWNFTVGKSAPLFEKLSKMPVRLGEVADIFVGLQTSADNVFIMDLIEETPRTLRLKSKALDTEWIFEKGLLFPLVSGTDVNRYSHLPERQYILFPYRVKDSIVEVIDFKALHAEYPKTTAYLLENKTRLEEREKGRVRGPNWYGYIYLKNMIKQSIKKLCVPRLVEKLYATYDVDGNHFLDNVDVGGITLKQLYEKQGLVYLLGLLNSKLLRWYFPFVTAPFRGGWMSANRQFLSQLPIRNIDFSIPIDKARHDQMVRLVDQMLLLHKQLAAAKTPDEKTRIQRQIDTTDQQIDQLVYELYGLTEKEIQIVEGIT